MLTLRSVWAQVCRCSFAWIKPPEKRIWRDRNHRKNKCRCVIIRWVKIYGRLSGQQEARDRVDLLSCRVGRGMHRAMPGRSWLGAFPNPPDRIADPPDLLLSVGRSTFLKFSPIEWWHTYIYFSDDCGLSRSFFPEVWFMQNCTYTPVLRRSEA